MNNDGWMSAGNGQDDRMVAGKDLQHYTQNQGADENPKGFMGQVRPLFQAGGPMKEMMDAELKRHIESAEMRNKDLTRG